MYVWLPRPPFLAEENKWHHLDWWPCVLLIDARLRSGRLISFQPQHSFLTKLQHIYFSLSHKLQQVRCLKCLSTSFLKRLGLFSFWFKIGQYHNIRRAYWHGLFGKYNDSYQIQGVLGNPALPIHLKSWNSRKKFLSLENTEIFEFVLQSQHCYSSPGYVQSLHWLKHISITLSQHIWPLSNYSSDCHEFCTLLQNLLSELLHFFRKFCNGWKANSANFFASHMYYRINAFFQQVVSITDKLNSVSS